MMPENLIEIYWSQIQNQNGKDSSDLKSPVLRGAIQAMIHTDKKAKALNSLVDMTANLNSTNARFCSTNKR